MNIVSPELPELQTVLCTASPHIAVFCQQSDCEPYGGVALPLAGVSDRARTCKGRLTMVKNLLVQVHRPRIVAGEVLDKSLTEMTNEGQRQEF